MKIEQKFLIEFLSLMKLLAYTINILQGNEEACADYYLLPTLINIQEWDFLQD